jgi:hypothetical protein
MNQNITNNGWFIEVCDVCRILDNDYSRQWVKHCDTCNANMCSGCTNSPLRRTIAAIAKFLGKD